jgi:hypothetical protein
MSGSPTLQVILNQKSGHARGKAPEIEQLFRQAGIDTSGFDPAALEVFKRTSAGWTLQAEALASQSPQQQREH